MNHRIISGGMQNAVIEAEKLGTGTVQVFMNNQPITEYKTRWPPCPLS